mgnify:CR=1 FL=1
MANSFFELSAVRNNGETLDFNIGLGMKAAFTPALEFANDTTVSSHMGYIKAGLDFKF